jgi:hypothetical protein
MNLKNRNSQTTYEPTIEEISKEIKQEKEKELTINATEKLK